VIAAIKRGAFSEAERYLLQARRWANDSEDLARLAFLTGRIAHGRHDYVSALAEFGRAAQFAVQAGALLEEATYLSGVAAAATELGQIDQALHASSRSLLLYEVLSRPAQAARASLSRANVLLVMGAQDEALEAGRETLRLAKQGGDHPCQAYAHLAIAEGSVHDPAGALEHLEHCARHLNVPTPADALRLGALRLGLGLRDNLSALDTMAGTPDVSAEARLAWWGARAQEVLDGDTTGGHEVLNQLSTLVSSQVGVGIAGPAFSAGRRLAASMGDGQLARRFAQLAGDAAQALRSTAPRKLQASLELKGWVASLDSRQAPSVSPEQIRQLDTLVRALTLQGGLRPLLNQILDALVLWTGVERGLLLLTAPGGKLVPRAARNLARSDLDGTQLELSYSLAERAISSRRPVVAVDAAGELPEHHPGYPSHRARSSRA
jgi:tetratricopeptide (TPR) repeat protein